MALQPVISCTDGFIDNAVTIRVKNLEPNLRYTITYGFGSLQGTIAESVSYSELTWTIPKSFYAQIPNAKEGVCYLTCQAYDGGKIGVGGCNFKAKVDPKRNAPTVEGIIEDTNPDTIALTGNTSRLVRYCSDARVTGAYVGKNSAAVESYSVTHGGAVYTKSPVDIFGVQTGQFQFQATDSRGLTTTNTVTKELIPYIKPTCKIGDTKLDGNGNMTLKVSGNYFNGSFGVQRNSLKVEYRYKVAGGAYSAWFAIQPSIDLRSYTAQVQLTGLDYETVYVFQTRAADKLRIASSAEYTVRAIPVFDWDENDFNINGSLKINEEAVADFVVSRGKSSIWTWEKWNSGIVKCWAISGEKTFAFTGSGPVYHSETVHSYNYPVALTEITSVNANIIAEGYVVPVILSTDGELQVSPVRLVGGSASVKGRYTFQLLGRWK